MCIRDRATIEARYNAVKQILTDYKEAIETMVKELLEKEVIDGARVREILTDFEKEKGLESRLVKRKTSDEEA